MNIDVNTKKMAVIGDPIEHSLSPLMHNSIIQANGFNAVYFPFHVKPSELRRYAESLRNLEFSGFNATMPHKQALRQLLPPALYILPPRFCVLPPDHRLR